LRCKSNFATEPLRPCFLVRLAPLTTFNFDLPETDGHLRRTQINEVAKLCGPKLDAILVDAQQCLGLVPRDVPTARIFVQGLVGVRSHPEPREVFLGVQHLNLQIKSVC
jgi:hypothetical protein